MAKRLVEAKSEKEPYRPGPTGAGADAVKTRRRDRLKVLKNDPAAPFRVFEVLKAGGSMTDAAAAVGVTANTLNKVMKTDDRFRAAAAVLADPVTKRGKQLAKPEKFFDYVYRQLPDELLPVWNRVVRLDQDRKNGLPTRRHLQNLLSPYNDELVQHLWLHAFVHHSFSASDACSCLGLPQSTVARWAADPHFKTLIDQLHVHKKDFFESALIKLVAAGDPQAVIFVNKTVNRDRGYGERSEVEVRRTSYSRVETLNLSDAALKELKAALDAKATAARVVELERGDGDGQ